MSKRFPKRWAWSELDNINDIPESTSARETIDYLEKHDRVRRDDMPFLLRGLPIDELYALKEWQERTGERPKLKTFIYSYIANATRRGNAALDDKEQVRSIRFVQFSRDKLRDEIDRLAHEIDVLTEKLYAMRNELKSRGQKR